MDWKGATSIKPCFRHVNVWKAGSGTSARRPGHVDPTCADHNRFERLERRELDKFVTLLRIAHDHRDDGEGGAARLKLLEQAFGFNVNSLGVVNDDGVRGSIDITTVHTTMQDGVVDGAIVALCKACEENRPPWRGSNVI